MGRERCMKEEVEVGEDVEEDEEEKKEEKIRDGGVLVVRRRGGKNSFWKRVVGGSLPPWFCPPTRKTTGNLIRLSLFGRIATLTTDGVKRSPQICHRGTLLYCSIHV